MQNQKLIAAILDNSPGNWHFLGEGCYKTVYYHVDYRDYVIKIGQIARTENRKAKRLAVYGIGPKVIYYKFGGSRNSIQIMERVKTIQEFWEETDYQYQFANSIIDKLIEKADEIGIDFFDTQKYNVGCKDNSYYIIDGYHLYS